MPIKITDLKPAARNVSPDYTLSGVNYQNSYDKGYRKEMVQEWNRANNQSWYNQLASGLVSRGLSIGTKFGAGVGSVLGASSALFSKDITDIWDNPLVNAMNEADDSLRESLPVYKSKRYMQGHLLEKMASTSFWFDDGFDGVAFLASAYGGGVVGKGIASGVRGLGAATGEIASAIAKPLNAIDESLVSATKTFGSLEGGMPTAKLADAGLQGIDDALGKYVATPTAKAALALRQATLYPFRALKEGLKKIGGTAHQGDLLAITAYNTVSEAGAEAYQTNKEIEGLLKDLRRTNPDYANLTDEDIKKKSSQAAAETFALNAAVLAVPNFIQSKMLFGSFKDRSSAIRKSIWDNKGETTAAMKELSSRWAAVGEGLASEGLWEENIQTAIQQYERAAGTNLKNNKNMALEIAKNYGNGIKGFVKSFLPGFSTDAMEDESAISIMLGGIIGGGMGARSAHVENQATKKEVTAEKGRYDKLFKEYGPAAQNLFVDNVKSIYQTNGKKKVTIKNEKGEDIEVEADNYLFENGELQKSPEALLRLTTNQLRNKHLFDAQLLAAYKNDPLMDEYNKQVGLAAYTHDLISKGYTAEEVAQHADELVTNGATEAKDLGVENYLQENVEKIKEYAKSLESIAAANASKEDIESEDIYENAYKNFLNKTEYYLGIKKKALENIKGTTQNTNTIESIDKLLEDINGVEQQLKTDKKGIREEYFNTVAPTLKAYAEYNALRENKAKTAEEQTQFDKLDYLLNEDLAINGRFAAHNVSYNNAYGATNKELVTTLPGTRQSHYYNMGRQALAVEQAKQNIAAGEDALRTANSLMDNAYYADEDFKNTIDPLIGVLQDQKDEMEKVQEDFDNTVGEILAFVEGDATIGEIDEATRDLLVEQGVVETDNNGIVDIDSYYDPTAENEQKLTALMGTIGSDADKTRERLAKTNSVIDRYNDLDEQNSKVTEHSKKLLTDKADEYLIQKYFQDAIANPTKNEIERFEQDKDNYLDLGKINDLITGLQRAKAAFTDREGDYKDVRDTIDELLQKLSQEIRPKVIENRESRRSKQLELNNSITQQLLNALGLLDKNSKVGNIVRSALDPEKVQAALDEINDNEGMLSYDAAIAIVSILKANSSEEELEPIVKELSEKLSSLLLQMENAFKDNITEKRLHPPKNFLGASTTLGGRSAYEVNPQSTMVSLLKRLFSKEIGEERTIAYKYVFDHDLNSLANGIENEKEFSEAQKKAFNAIYALHIQAAELAKVLGILKNKSRDVTSIVAAKKGLSGMAPTPQQNIILSEVLSFYFNGVPTSQLDYEGWMLVKGIAGSGKSFVIGKMLSSLINAIDPKATGYAFSNNQFTSDNINKAIYGHNNNKNNIEQFLGMTDLELNKLSYIVIDEVFTLPEARLNEVKEKLKAHHKATGHDIKVIALGDPSQSTADETTAHSLMTHKALRSAQTFSMSVSYRTNVGAISSFISSYQLNASEVETSFVQANKTAQESETNMSDTVGVHGGNLDQMIRLLNAPSSRSRVVLVSNELDQEDLRKNIPAGIPVLLYKDAQGYQWDEVYTYLDKGTMGDSTIQKNRGLYTAFSRAKQYLYVTGLGVSNIEPDPKLSNSIDENPEDLKLNTEDFKQNIATAANVVSILTGAAPVTAPVVTPTAVEITDEEDAFDAGPSDVEITPIEDETGLPTDIKALNELPSVTTTKEADAFENKYTIAHPTNYNVRDVKNGATIHIIRAKNTKGKDFYYLVTNTSGNNYVVVGVLGNKDFKDDLMGDKLKAILDVKPSIFIPKDTIIQEGFRIDNIDNVSLQTAVLDEYNGLGNSYDTDENGGLVYRMQNDIVEDIIKKFYSSFFGKDQYGRRVYPDEMVTRGLDGEVILDKDGNPVYDANNEWVKNGKINWGIVSKHTRVIIFDRKNKPAGSHAGIPYLEIMDPRQASLEKRSTKSAKSMFIPMQPKKFSRTSNHFGPLRELYDTLSELSTLSPKLTLGSDSLVDLLEKSAKSNYTLKDVGGKFEQNLAKRYSVKKTSNTVSSQLVLAGASKEMIAQADVLIDKLIDLIYAPDYKRVYMASKDEADAEIGKVYEGKKVVGSKAQANGKHILQYQADTEGEDIQDLKIIALRAGKGRAQKALNVLAQANKYLTDGSGVSIQLRIEQQSRRKTENKLDEFKLTRAKSLLSTETYTDYAAIYNEHPEWEVTQGMFKNRDHLKNHLVKHGKVTAEEFENIIFNNTSHAITLGVLELVVGDKYFDEQGNHSLNGFYLREPLDSRTFAKTGINDIGSDLSVPGNRNQLASMLRTAYTGTAQTKVSIKLGATTKTEEFAPTSAFELLSKLPAVYDEDTRRVQALLLSKGKDVPVGYDPLVALKGKKGGMANKDVIYFNYDPTTLGQGGTLNVLHELLHANLNQGLISNEEFRNEIRELFKIVKEHANKQGIPLTDFMNGTISTLDEFEFIANLSHPPFIEELKKIKVKKNTVLQSLIDSILKLLGINTTDAYEVMFASIEKFLSPPAATNAQEKEFEKLSVQFQSIMDYVDNYSKKYYESFFDFKAAEFTEEFMTRPIEDRIQTLKDFMNFDPAEASGIGDDYYGYYNEPGVFFSSSPGALVSNQSIMKLYDTVVGRVENETVRNLIATILSKQVQDPVSKVLTNILSYYDTGDMNNLFDTIVNDVLTVSDRRMLSEDLKVSLTELSEALQFSDTYFPIFDEAIGAIVDNRTEVENLVESSDLFATKRYEIARNYIIEKIRGNRNAVDGLIKTKGELLESVLAELRGASNPTIELRAELDQKLALVSALSSMVASGDTSRLRDLRTLLESTVPALEQRLAALSSLTSTNKRTGKIVFYDIVSDIYPKNKYTEDEDLSVFLGLMEDSEDTNRETRDDKEAEDSSGIGEHIKKYNKSYEVTLSEAVKDFLSLVEANGKPLNPSLVYIKTLQYLTTIDTTSIPIIKEQLHDTLSNKGLSVVDYAIYVNLLEVVSKATNNYNSYTNTALPTNVGIITATNNGVTYYKGLHSATSVKGLSEASAKITPGVTMSGEFYNSTALFKWLNSKSPITIDTYNSLLTKAEATNALRELQNVMASMKETELMIGTRTNKKGIEVAYIRSKAMGISTSAKESIKQSFEDLYKQNKLQGLGTHFKVLYPEDYAAIFGSQGKVTIEEKKKAIKSFFNVLGLSSLTAELTIADQEVSDLVETIIFIAKEAKKVRAFSKEDEVNASELSEDNFEDLEGTITFFVKDMDAKINLLADVASKSSIYLRNPSVRSSSGEKFYKFHESSWGYDVMLNLIRMKKNNFFKGTRGGNEFRREHSHLNTDFYTYNIFKTGLSQLTFMGEHEALKNIDNNSITSYTRESKFHYFHREFIQGFLDGARQYNGNSFFLFNYTPSDKPKTPLFRVSLLSDKEDAEGTSEIKKGIKASLQQFLDKEGVRLDVANYNKSNREDRYRNFTLAADAEARLQEPLSSANIDKYVNTIHELLEEEASKLAEELMEVELTFDVNTFRKGKVSGANRVQQNLSKSLNSKFNTDSAAWFSNYTNEGGVRKYAIKKELILPLVDLYVKNHYVNSFHLNQLMTGDYAAYKNAADLVKRLIGVYAPGIRGLVDPEIGMKEKFEVLVLKDTSVGVTTTDARLRKLIFGEEKPTKAEEKEFKDLLALFDSYDIADAQGFMLPSRYADMEKGFGRGWGLGNVMKPVHFEVIEKSVVKPDGTTYSTAIPVYMKYSSIVLEDTLVKKFPMLSKLREKLERLGVDELIFNTGIKTGTPSVRDSAGLDVDDLTFEKFMSMEDVTELRQYQTTPLLSMSNKHFRLQHNPATDPKKNIAIFTQLMYFLNVYESTHDSAREAYSLVGELIKLGREDFMDSLSLRRFLAKSFSGPGAERALELLRVGVSLNNPLLEKKAIIALASGLEAATVKIKFPGGKLVLQTPQGIAKYYDPELFADVPETAEELSYKTEMIGETSVTYAEVIVPSELLTPDMLQAVKDKKTIFMYGDGMGFRIPSSELHSAVPLRIVGVYSGSGTNVIIGPKELIPIHGSDFDVDSIQMIMRENFTTNDLTKIDAAQLSSFIESLTHLHDLVHGLEEGMSETDAAEVKRFRNLLLQKFELEEENDELLKKEMDPNFQAEIRAAYQEQLKANPELPVEQFALDNGYKYNSGIYKINSELGSNIFVLEQEIKKFEKENAGLVSKYKVIRDAMKQQRALIEKSKAIKKTTNLQLLDTPIGYEKLNGLYVVNPTFSLDLDVEIENLQDLLPQAEIVSKNLKRQVNDEIKRLKNIKVKFIKNNITEVMLKVITDKKNLYRMVSPITFTPLREALNRINKDLMPSKSLDLSNPREKYKSYQSLADGAILTGAFANAVKVFGYVTRAGGDDVKLKEMYAKMSELTLRIKQFGKAGKEEETLANLVKQKQAITKQLREYVATLNNQELRPFLSNTYEFSLSINGKEHLFNRFAERDITGKYSATTIFDSLLNASIDNLKLGLLPELRVNTRTGSAVVGLVSLGVPIENIIQLVYSPILAPLSSGTVDKVKDWAKKIETKYEALLNQVRAENRVLTDKQILSASNSQKELSDMSEEELKIQLAVFELFNKANKIGEDVRNLSTFLNIIRKSEVFIEDIDGVEADLHNNVGTVVDTNGDIVLVPRADYSLVIPNIFRNNPHIKEAYTTHKELVKKINETFALHSAEIRAFVNSINFSSLDTDDEVDDKVTNLAKARASVATMLLSNIVWDDVQVEPNTVVNLGKDKKLILSKARSYSERIARELKMVQEYVKSNPSQFKLPNRFLDLVIVSKNPMTNTLGIRLAGGVNLSSIDIQDITRGFRMLNQFAVENGEVIKLPPNRGISKLQKELLTYAVINYGLQFSTSNFSNVIDTRLIADLDEKFNNKLTEFVGDVESAERKAAWKDFFYLTYHMMNANRLGFVDFSRVQSEPITDSQGKTIARIYAGKDMLASDTLLGATRPVYYDRKVKKATKKGERPNPSMFSVDFKNKTEVFLRVESTDAYDYYQKVGKVSEAFFTKMRDNNYSTAKYFDPSIATIDYTMAVTDTTNVVGEKMKVLSPTNADYMKPGDVFYIVPAYNFDRQERQLVKLVSKSERIDNKYRSYQYEVEVVDKMNVPTSAPEQAFVQTYKGLITHLYDNWVFVFGSNPLGINGNLENNTGGAALVALKNKWLRQGEILDNKLSATGKAWGLTTVSAPGKKRSKSTQEIKEGIRKLYEYATQNPNKHFVVAYTTNGKNLNGYTAKEMAAMFSSYVIPDNVAFEEEFAELLTVPTSYGIAVEPLTSILNVLDSIDQGCK